MIYQRRSFFLWSECTRQNNLDTASVKKMIQIMGPAPLPPCRCVRRGSFATSGVGFLVTLTDTRMNGEECSAIGRSARGCDRNSYTFWWIAQTRAQALSEWVRRAGTQPFETMARELYSLHETDLVLEVLDSDSCFGRQLNPAAFNGTPSRLFKTTYAYMWGMLRLSARSAFVAHIDNDYTVMYPRKHLDWIATALELLERHPALRSVHPSSSEGFGYARRSPDCRESRATGACTCVDIRSCSPLRDGTSLNSFKAVVSLALKDGRTFCGHTVNALNRGGRHFSFQAWVTMPAHFVRMWPLTQPGLHIETIFDHLNVARNLTPVWLPLSVGGWKVKLSRKTRDEFTRKLSTAVEKCSSSFE